MYPKIEEQYLQPKHIMHSIFRCVKYLWHSFTCFTSLKQAKTLHGMFSSLLAGVEQFKPSRNRCHSLGFSMFKVGAQCLPGKLFCALAAGKARESAWEWEKVGQDGSIYPWLQRSALPQPRWELCRAEQKGSLSSCSSSSQMLSICTSICTFCQSDSIITTCSVFELLEYFLHYLMLRWDNVFRWTMGCSGLLAPRARGECCPSAFQRGT